MTHSTRTARPSRHEFLSLPRRPVRVVLDAVSLLPNIGTMFRLCDLFRVEKLYVCGFDLRLHKRSLVKAASGSLPWVPWEARESALDVVRESRDAGYSVAVVEIDERAVRPHELATEKPVCLVLGAERKGVSEGVLALADQRIEIPTDGMITSMNLTTAGAIVLYELSRRFDLPPYVPPAAGAESPAKSTAPVVSALPD